MENTPVLQDTDQAPSKELELRPTNYGDIYTSPDHEPTTPIDEEQWNQIVNWTLTLHRTGDMLIQRQFGVDKRTATAVFEEMQARGYVTKLSIPAPGKGAKGEGYDADRFGGYMVLVNPDGTSRHPNPPTKLPRGPEFVDMPQPVEAGPEQSDNMGSKTKLGRGALRALAKVGKAEVSVVEPPANFVGSYVQLKKYHIADSVDYLTGGRRAREKDAADYKFDRMYAEIFDPHLGEVTPLTDKQGSIMTDQNGNPIMALRVPSWVKQGDAKPWQRTVPSLEIIDPNAEPEDGLSTAEREVDAEIAAMRANREGDNVIKTSLLKKYHPDREDGGNIDKVSRVTNRFMQKRNHNNLAPLPNEPDVEKIIEETIELAANEAAEKQTEEASQAEEINNKQRATKAAEAKGQTAKVEDPFTFAVEYLAGRTRPDDKKDQVFPQMSEESLVRAFAKRGVGFRIAMQTYQELKDMRFINSDDTVDTKRVTVLLNAHQNGETDQL